nr:hypothetical protein Iba_chr13aCG9130 [Ipomoea batatas]
MVLNCYTEAFDFPSPSPGPERLAVVRFWEFSSVHGLRVIVAQKWLGVGEDSIPEKSECCYCIDIPKWFCEASSLSALEYTLYPACVKRILGPNEPCIPKNQRLTQRVIYGHAKDITALKKTAVVNKGPPRRWLLLGSSNAWEIKIRTKTSQFGCLRGLVVFASGCTTNGAYLHSTPCTKNPELPGCGTARKLLQQVMYSTTCKYAYGLRWPPWKREGVGALAYWIKQDEHQAYAPFPSQCGDSMAM